MEHHPSERGKAMSESSNECGTCKGCPDCGPSSTKRTPEAIAARLGKVSEGPWRAWDRGIGYEVHGPAGEPINMGCRETFEKGDAEFIAMAPSDVHYLLTLARKQAAALEAVIEWCDTNQYPFHPSEGAEGFSSQDWALDDAARRVRTSVTAALKATK